MDLNELEALAAVHLYGSYVEGSHYTGVPISTLSKRISRAEQELGVNIFKRKTASNSVVLTEHGAVLMPLIRKFLNTYGFMMNRLDNLRDDKNRPLAVGKALMLGNMGDGEVISDFLNDHPDVEIISILRSHTELVRMLTEGVIDCAFIVQIGNNNFLEEMWSAFGGDQYDIVTLSASSQMYIGISEQDPLARKDSVAIQELKGHCFIFNKWHEEQRRAAGRGLSFFECQHQNEADFSVRMEDFINREYIYGLVAGGAGVLPQVFKSDRKVEGVKFLKLENWPQESTVVFISRKYGGHALKNFVEYVKSAAHEKNG